MLRCSLGPARGPLIGVKVLAGLDRRRSKRAKDECVRQGWSPGYPPQSSPAVSLKPDIRPWCVSGCQSCHGKERGAERQTHCAAWTPVSLRSTTVQRVSGLPRHESPEPRNPARKSDRSYRDSCNRRLSSRTARTKGSFTTGQACKGIFFADQTGFACKELRVRELAAFPRCSVCEQLKARSAPRRNGPCPSRRIPVAVRSSALIWEFGQSRQLLFRAHRQYLRLRFRSREIALGSAGRTVLMRAHQRTSSLSGKTSVDSPSI